MMKQTKTHLSNAELLSIRDDEHLDPDARDHLARCEYCQDMLKHISEDADLIKASRPMEPTSEAGHISKSSLPEVMESASLDSSWVHIDEKELSTDEDDGLFGKQVIPEPEEPLPPPRLGDAISLFAQADPVKPLGTLRLYENERLDTGIRLRMIQEHDRKEELWPPRKSPGRKFPRQKSEARGIPTSGDVQYMANDRIEPPPASARSDFLIDDDEKMFTRPTMPVSISTDTVLLQLTARKIGFDVVLTVEVIDAVQHESMPDLEFTLLSSDAPTRIRTTNRDGMVWFTLNSDDSDLIIHGKTTHKVHILKLF
jgi:hypothetical protein